VLSHDDKLASNGEAKRLKRVDGFRVLSWVTNSHATSREARQSAQPSLDEWVLQLSPNMGEDM
jgi:hypothetical protein